MHLQGYHATEQSRDRLNEGIDSVESDNDASVVEGQRNVFFDGFRRSSSNLVDDLTRAVFSSDFDGEEAEDTHTHEHDDEESEYFIKAGSPGELHGRVEVLEELQIETGLHLRCLDRVLGQHDRGLLEPIHGELVAGGHFFGWHKVPGMSRRSVLEYEVVMWDHLEVKKGTSRSP